MADGAADRLKRLDEFKLHDLESVRLILRGDSVVDWHRLNLESEADARTLLHAQEFRPGEPQDRVLSSLAPFLETEAPLERLLDFTGKHVDALRGRDVLHGLTEISGERSLAK